ncbi:polyprotein [Phytophthora megakarya]|uniref:Polyprotein n=1 Tax=Phytophthora megakarya TaxID=4795 RepID=A0A225WXW2_9STRA|nr:polyprotein [Phytophthora megakarya]
MANFSVGDLILAASAVKGGSKLALNGGGQSVLEAGREVTEDLIAHVLHGEGGHLVGKLLQCRLNSTYRQWKIFVQWVGLEPEEGS